MTVKSKPRLKIKKRKIVREVAKGGPLLKNMGELAAALGVPYVFVKRMKWAGFQMPGGKSTTEWALDWLKDNPHFQQADYTRPVKGTSGRPAGRQG